MLFYLDNWQSADPNGPHRRRRRSAARRRAVRFGAAAACAPHASGARRSPRRSAQNAQKRGLNENYGRELMELHTLGVDGGYTQKDVIEVARAFTGWTIDQPAPGRRLPLRAAHARRRREDRARPRDQGRRRRVATASRCSTSSRSIRRRRASSRPSWRAASSPTTPPPALVDRAAERFRETDGDIREVVRTILTSPEFFAAEAYRAKVKTPFEFVVSARARDRRRRRRRAAARADAARSSACRSTCASRRPATRTRADAWVNTGALSTA